MYVLVCLLLGITISDQLLSARWVHDTYFYNIKKRVAEKSLIGLSGPHFIVHYDTASKKQYVRISRCAVQPDEICSKPRIETCEAMPSMYPDKESRIPETDAEWNLLGNNIAKDIRVKLAGRNHARNHNIMQDLNYEQVLPQRVEAIVNRKG